MANIVRRNDYSMAPTTEWDPFRMMREMMRWDPFRVAGLAPQVDRDVWLPHFEVRENSNSIRIVADVPAVKREDLEISVNGNRLMISGHRESEDRSKDENIHTYERQYGEFTRSFTLPDNADLDHITSELRDGALTILVPLTTSSRARRIQIGGTAPKS